MKRVTSLLIIIVILCVMVLPVSATSVDNTVQPRWTYLDSVYAYLDINWLGVASCEGRATAGDFVAVKVVVRLQQLKDTGWATIKSWTATDTQTVGASGSYAVYSGYTYRVSVTGYVYDSNGNLVEAGTATDTFVY